MDDSHLVIGAGDRLVSLSMDTLKREASWASTATVTGLGADDHGLYVASAAGVEVVDPAGRPLAMLNAPPIGDVAYIGILTG